MRATDMKGYTLGSVSKNKSSRVKKAQKIIQILKEHTSLKGKKVLDIGTGSGYIAHAISREAARVDSVDIVDDRIVKEGYRQKIVKDEVLPFKDHSFDIVITNQVLEHVPDHHKHLSEIRRVLKDNGIVYLASPNKWWITDPHYNLPFISWLPHSIASWYLKITKKRKWDIYSVSLRRLHNLAKNNGFTVHDKMWNIVANPVNYSVNISGFVLRLSSVVPVGVKRMLLHVVPTHIKVLSPKSQKAK